MRTVLALAFIGLFAGQAAAQCSLIPFGLSEREFLRVYSARMEATGAGDLLPANVLSPQKKMYQHISTSNRSRFAHSISVESRDDMVRQAQFVFHEEAPEALRERVRIGAAFVMTLAPGTAEPAALSAIERALRASRGSRRPATERAGDGLIHVEPFDNAFVLSVGRVRC